MSIFIAPKLKGRKRSKKASTQDRKKVHKQERKKEENWFLGANCLNVHKKFLFSFPKNT